MIFRNLERQEGKRDGKVQSDYSILLHRVVSQHGQPGGVEETATDIAAKRATDMVCELYRRNVWTDDRTVAILAFGSCSRPTRQLCAQCDSFWASKKKWPRMSA
jgi:protein SDA1